MKSFRTVRPYITRRLAVLIAGIVFVLLANAFGMLVPLTVGATVNEIEARRIGATTLAWLVVAALTASGLEGSFRFLMRRLLIDASRDMEYELRNDVFRKLTTLDPSFFDRNNTGDLMSRTTNDMDAVRMLIGPGIMYTANTIFSLPLAIAGMLWLDWRLTLMAMVPMLALPPLVKYFGHRTHEVSKLQQDSFGEMTTMVQENLAGVRVIKAYGQEGYEQEKFGRRNEDYIDKSMQLAWLQSLFFPSIRGTVGLGYVVLLLVGGWQITNGQLQVGTLIAFLLLFSQIVWPLIAAGWVVNLIQRGMASLERVNMILESTPKVVEPRAAVAVPSGPLTIEFRNLTFQYEGTERPQLRDISLTVEPGRSLGIVGPVGSGKSTLVNLLAHLYPVPRGTIFLGGIDINDWPLAELRSRVGFVFQETFLFSDTIGWNIRFGADDDTSQEDVERSARQAQVHDAITAFPKSYDTILGERGVNLSGGQKQRVSIARTLVKGAGVLVLDDTLSAVDTHTEEAILGELRHYMAGRNTFLISHRLSTVALADEIIVLEGGRITQRGTHAELIAAPGLYSELYRKQQTEQELEAFDNEPAEVAAK